MPEPLALCQQVSKTYKTASGGIEALHAVDAQLHAGQVTALVGASGSGKSTLLRALAGLDRPSSGSILVDGTELADASAATLRRHRRSGVTFINQKPADNLIPHLSLREHDGGRGVDLLVEFGLAHRLDAKPSKLSGGEQARAAFALALARGTAMLLADEPTAELDRDSAAPLLATIRAHAQTGAALVIATHDDDVTALADTVIRLDRGRVIIENAAIPRGRRPPRSAESETVLAARGVSKGYRRGPEQIHALTAGNLDLRRGEVGALLGRSGSGKSTLLAILAGLQQPDSGQIDRAVNQDLPWSELAFLPQRFGLLPELSIRENIEYPARLSGTLTERDPGGRAAHRPPRPHRTRQQTTQRDLDRSTATLGARPRPCARADGAPGRRADLSPGRRLARRRLGAPRRRGRKRNRLPRRNPRRTHRPLRKPRLDDRQRHGHRPEPDGFADFDSQNPTPSVGKSEAVDASPPSHSPYRAARPRLQSNRAHGLAVDWRAPRLPDVCSLRAARRGLRGPLRLSGRRLPSRTRAGSSQTLK